jgi:hypothetical protein
MNSGARSRHLPPPRRPPPAACPPSSPLATAEPSGERVWLNGGRRPGRTVETLTGRVNQLGEAEPVQRRAAATSEAARHPRSRAWRHAGTAPAAACSSSTRAALRSRTALRRVVAVDESALAPDPLMAVLRDTLATRLRDLCRAAEAKPLHRARLDHHRRRAWRRPPADGHLPRRPRPHPARARPALTRPGRCRPALRPSPKRRRTQAIPL